MRIQLIHPPQRISATNYVSAVAIPPLGLAYLAAALEAAGHTVCVIDGVAGDFNHIERVHGQALRGQSFDQIIEAIDPQADLIGIGLMFSSSWPSMRELVRLIKTRWSNKPLVVGGEHATALPELILSETNADLCVVGEGEVTLVELCDRLQQGYPLDDLPGIVRRVGGQIVINPPRERIRNIDDIPLPAWHHFDIEGYIALRQPHGSADGRSMPILATRGCPYHCSFCSASGTWTTRWIPRDPVRLVDEMELYMRRYGVNDFHFEDLTAIVRKDWTLAFCNEIIKRGLKISWQMPSGTRSEAIDEQVAQAMFAAGCRQFTYAIESGSPRVLERIRKKIKIKNVFASARSAMRAGIRVQAAFVLGFPFETFHDLLQTYLTIIRCAVAGFHEINIAALAPLPNTPIFRELQAAGRLEMNDDYLDSIFGYMDFRNYRSWHPHIPDWLLRSMILFAYASFFALSYLLRPGRLWRLFRGLSGPQTDGKLAKIIKGLRTNTRLLKTATT